MRFQTNVGYANSNKCDVSKKKKKKTRETIVLCRINWWGVCVWGGGGGGCNSIKMGLRGMLVCYFIKIETVFGCRNSNDLLIHQDFF